MRKIWSGVFAIAAVLVGSRVQAVTVAINATNTVATVPYTAYGVNFPSWNSDDNGGNATYVAEIKAAGSLHHSILGER